MRRIQAFLQRDASRRYRKRMTVIVCAVVNLGVTLYIVHAVLGTALQPGSASPPSSSSSSSSLVNYMRSWHSSSYGARSLAKVQQMIAKSGIDARLGSLPLELMRRVKDIQLEAAALASKQASAAKTEDEKLQELGLSKQAEVETWEQVQRVSAVEDDEQGAIERLLPPECHPEPNSDFG